MPEKIQQTNRSRKHTEGPTSLCPPEDAEPESSRIVTAATAIDTINGDHDTPPASIHGIRAVFVFAGLFLAILMAGLDALAVSTALPSIASSLRQQKGLAFVVSTFLITSTISIPIFGRLSDIISRRNVFLAGLAIFIAGSILAGLSQNIGELIAFVGVQGVGSGGFLPVGIAIVTVLFPPETRARLVGVLSAGGGLSIVLGPLLGSYIVDNATWQWIFYVNIPIGLASMALVWLALGPLRPESSGRFDVLGATLLAGWVSALLFALLQITYSGWTWTDPRTVALLSVAVLLFGAFLFWELRTKEPLVPFRFLSRRVWAASAGVILFNGIVLTSMTTFLSILVGIVLLHSAPGATNQVRDVIYFVAIPMIIGAGLTGLLLTRFSYLTVIAPALVIAGLSGVALFFVSARTPLWVLSFGFIPVGGLVLPLIPIGFGMGVALAGPMIIVMNEAPLKEGGAAISLMRFLQSLGGAVGLLLLSVYQIGREQFLAARTTSPVGIQNATVTSFDEVFLALAVVSMIAFGFALFLRGRIRDVGELH